ncbi:hypothetical protein H6504_00440 [Candidatus Woesearchaeota archaeon]|nr:hypothetical protein [Candidatus Woesearchaeota archaeon]
MEKSWIQIENSRTQSEFESINSKYCDKKSHIVYLGEDNSIVAHPATIVELDKTHIAYKGIGDTIILIPWHRIIKIKQRAAG